MTAVEEELIAREQEWMEVVRRKDLAALEQILAPEYVYTASGQGRWPRERWMETVPIYDIRHFAFHEVDVHAYGDVAVVLSRYEQKASVAGAQRSGEFLLTDVWVRRNDAWQVVTRSSIMALEPRGREDANSQ